MFTSREAGLEESNAQVELQHNIQDEFKRLSPVSTSSKIKAFDCYVDQTGTAKVIYSKKCISTAFFM